MSTLGGRHHNRLEIYIYLLCNIWQDMGQLSFWLVTWVGVASLIWPWLVIKLWEII